MTQGQGCFGIKTGIIPLKGNALCDFLKPKMLTKKWVIKIKEKRVENISHKR